MADLVPAKSLKPGGVYRLVILDWRGRPLNRRNCYTCKLGYVTTDLQCRVQSDDPSGWWDTSTYRWCCDQTGAYGDVNREHSDGCPTWEPWEWGHELVSEPDSS